MSARINQNGEIQHMEYKGFYAVYYPDRNAYLVNVDGKIYEVREPQELEKVVDGK